jgi:tryptophanyl-tRNA synthetase
MGFDNPALKMSKTYAHIRNHAVRMLDEPSEIERTILRAVTDSGNEIRFSDDVDKAGVNNLLGIYEVITGQSMEEVERSFASARGYGDLKKRVAEVVIAELAPIRERYERLMLDPAELDRLLAIGADHARGIADAKLDEMKAKVGLLSVPRRPS